MIEDIIGAIVLLSDGLFPTGLGDTTGGGR